MKILKAITLSIGELEQPVITSYQLGLIIFNLYKTKIYKGEPITNIQKEVADSTIYNKIIRLLDSDGILIQYKGLPLGAAYSLLGRSHESIEDVVCIIDPFSYVSHLSAMEFHGLTNRGPSKLFVSSPAPKQWKIFALERMGKDLKKDCKTYQENKMPLLRRTVIKKIGRREIHRFSSVHWGAYKNVKGRSMRVSTIGRTFLDMLRNPELCGGIDHVLDVFDKHGRDYINLIVDEIDQHGGPIDKVRAGYIFDERLGLKFEKEKSWIKFAQRGGSRRLDASSEYEPVWSEKWCLSLNIISEN
ncbi:MAG: hypothetical protein OEY38_00035 [Gammaproteobacteria bacterium]|nr:hypothetical protein [Gammaproteobacteria bacterium]